MSDGVVHSAVCLRMANLGFAVVDTFDGQLQLIFMMLGFALVFRSPVSENLQQGNLVFLEEGQYPIIEHYNGPRKKVR